MDKKIVSDEDLVDETKERLKIFDVWKEYEGVAMHFNELIIQLRVQALAGVAALSAFVGFLSKGDTPEEYRWGVLATVLVALIFVWISIFCLDILYYDKLLRGSVQAILELEEASKRGIYISELNLSTRIEKEITSGNLIGLKENPWKSGRLWFYGIIFLLLSLGAIFSFNKQHCVKFLSKDASVQKCQQSTATSQIPIIEKAK